MAACQVRGARLVECKAVAEWFVSALGRAYYVCDFHYGAARSLAEAADLFGEAYALERLTSTPQKGIVGSREW